MNKEWDKIKRSSKKVETRKINKKEKIDEAGEETGGNGRENPRNTEGGKKCKINSDKGNNKIGMRN